MSGHDLIACAQTGTGKTGAYLLPVLNRIIHAKERHTSTLILAPTRELAQQIDQQIEGLGYFVSVSSMPVYGGGDGFTWDQQKRSLAEGADIITATPGRLIAMLSSYDVNFTHLQHLVLDEADRMLDMGFYDDIMRIVSYLPANRQTLLFSATMPPKIRTLAKKILLSPKEVSIAIAKPASGVHQQAYLVYDHQKERLIKLLLKNDSFQSVLIFASTKEKVKRLGYTLRHAGLSIKAFHSDLEQSEREEILREFKSRKLRILIGTDVLSRGIDVEGIDLVINYDSPSDPEDYVHRVGRTARATAEGIAITLISEYDQRKFAGIENLIRMQVPKLPLPPELGEGTAWEPLKRREKNYRRPERSDRRSSGKR